MVGDSWTDMQAATNAGVKGAFCTFGFGRLNDSRFTVKINRFEELLRHLKAEE
jgi:phosphoglycolate phosphatase-like HAD superfamily hydrolase